eukprot:CAMPEP_0117443010 /NCGR_PEP_ID=MMETSP0759-20121206/4464_1 /TAXON_ID=63605 /ORGANISM="Percolomonas cosmopolitus, Strain WS" /LENGTH=360 /DNA_ID=CAMNT_0005234951 /DNA_START=579 /DNA_END=1658 /DNA_ORIENTATION=-
MSSSVLHHSLCLILFLSLLLCLRASPNVVVVVTSSSQGGDDKQASTGHVEVSQSGLKASGKVSQRTQVTEGIEDVKRLETFNIQPNSLSISGLSSGAFLSVQFQFAHSSRVLGAGIVAGGPFYSALGNAFTAQEIMVHPELISTTQLELFAEECALTGEIDPLSNLRHHRVYIYSGEGDTVVHQGVSKKLEEMYHTNEVEVVRTVYNMKSEHGMPTLKQGIGCDKHFSPFILKCNYSASGDLLQTIYDQSLVAPNDEDNFVKENLIVVNQKEFLPPIVGHFIGMADNAYVYVPSGCQSKDTACKLHVHFHGCKQSYTAIGDEYVMHNGMNAWAERNNIILLYPQTKATDVPLNVYGCFDW